jgi:Na+-transporting methylmalonyl-CoA/oxaloacetate decarboxylase gamma subunit
MEMNNLTFGITLLIVGMGGTLVTLGIMALVMAGLGKIFPDKPAKEG